MSAGVKVSIEVRTDPARAFRVFTEEIDRWWRRGPKYRFLPDWHGTLQFDVDADLRRTFVETHDDGRRFTVGEIDAWEPGRRIAMRWRLPNFREHEETRVEISFDGTDRGTRVTIVHEGFDRLPTDHPARHGMHGRELEYAKANLWADQLRALRDQCAVVAHEPLSANERSS